MEVSTLQAAQTKSLNTALKGLILLATPLVILSHLRMLEIGWKPVMGLHTFLWLLATAGYFRLDKLSNNQKAAILITIFVSIGLGSALHNGSVQFGFIYHLLALLIATLTFSQLSVRLFGGFLLLGLLLLEAALHQGLSLDTFTKISGFTLLGLLVILVVNHMRNALEQTNKTLRKASEAKSDFLAHMSHELRTPMNGILGMSEVLLMDHHLTEEHQDQVRVIHKSGHAMLSLINELLDLAKIEAGQLELYDEPFQLSELLEDLRALLTPLAFRKGIHLELQAPAEWDPNRVLFGDEGRLRQVLLNLLNNALKFTQEGEVRLEVTASTPEAEDKQVALRFAVHDTGIGIPPEKQALLFRSFQQLGKPSSQRPEGTGLGLAISKQIVELMGGTIGVQSEPDKGSCFFFTLSFQVGPQTSEAPNPTALAEEVAQAKHAKRKKQITPPEPGLAKEAPGLQACRILLVEDNTVNQMVAQALLKRVGITAIDWAKNGTQALEFTSTSAYDLIFMDVQMAGMDGLEATRRIRAGEQGGACTDVPIVAITANALQDERGRCLEAGMDGCIVKPLTMYKLKEALDLHLPTCAQTAESKAFSPPSTPHPGTHQQ